jgi:hypothetical protein
MAEILFGELTEYLNKIPSVESHIASGIDEDGRWWVKFSIDIDHDLAWQVVQELGHVVNYLSIDEQLPTIFYPVSPPPYMNGGPKEYLSWVIESKSSDFLPSDLKDWLEGRLPRPVDDLNEWKMDDEE